MSMTSNMMLLLAVVAKQMKQINHNETKHHNHHQYQAVTTTIWQPTGQLFLSSRVCHSPDSADTFFSPTFETIYKYPNQRSLPKSIKYLKSRDPCVLRLPLRKSKHETPESFRAIRIFRGVQTLSPRTSVNCMTVLGIFVFTFPKMLEVLLVRILTNQLENRSFVCACAPTLTPDARID